MLDFVYVSRRPGPPLDRFVESVWYARGRIDYPRERIAPTGSTVAVIVLGDPIRDTPNDGAGEPFTAGEGFLLGPHDRPVINEPLGETYCVGIVTTPIGCRPLFGIAPARLRGRVVDLMRWWPPGRLLRHGLRRLTQPDAMLDRVESALLACLNAGDNPAGKPGGAAIERCEAAVLALEADPAQPIGELAARLGVSHGYLDREFTIVVGLSPRALSRILRLRTLLADIDVYQLINWTRHAADLGWFDQSHFIRDFKRHTGVTPSRYAAAQRSAYAPEQAAPGFVPDS